MELIYFENGSIPAALNPSTWGCGHLDRISVCEALQNISSVNHRIRVGSHSNSATDKTDAGGSTERFGWGHGCPDRASRRGQNAQRRMKKTSVGLLKTINNSLTVLRRSNCAVGTTTNPAEDRRATEEMDNIVHAVRMTAPPCVSVQKGLQTHNAFLHLFFATGS